MTDTSDGPLGASTVEQFGKRNNLSRPTVYDEIARGRLRARKVNSKTLIFHEDEQAWKEALPVLVLNR